MRVLGIATVLSNLHGMSKELAYTVFSNQFMDKLDKEMAAIENSGRKNNFEFELKKKLMILNRSVVLHYPEYGVPWFHKNFCQQNRTKLINNRRSEDGMVMKEDIFY